MKNTFFRSIAVTTLGFLLLAPGMNIRAIAQGEAEPNESAMEGRGRDIVGVWINQVTRRNCETDAIIESFQTQTTFSKGGTYLETIAPSVFRSYGNGLWKRNTGSEYSLTQRFMRYDAAGIFVGSVIVRALLVVDNDGDSYTSTARNDILSPNGSIIATGCATTSATRLVQE